MDGLNERPQELAIFFLFSFLKIHSLFRTFSLLISSWSIPLKSLENMSMKKKPLGGELICIVR